MSTDIERKWEKHSSRYAKSIQEQWGEEMETNFLSVSFVLANMAFSCLFTLILEHPVSVGEFNRTAFKKSIKSINRKKTESCLRLFFMDYVSQWDKNESLLAHFKAQDINIQKLKEKLLDRLDISVREKKQLEEFNQKNDTVFASIVLLEELGLGIEAKNEGFIMATEEIKRQFFDHMSNKLIALTKKD